MTGTSRQKIIIIVIIIIIINKNLNSLTALVNTTTALFTHITKQSIYKEDHFCNQECLYTQNRCTF